MCHSQESGNDVWSEHEQITADSRTPPFEVETTIPSSNSTRPERPLLAEPPFTSAGENSTTLTQRYRPPRGRARLRCEDCSKQHKRCRNLPVDQVLKEACPGPLGDMEDSCPASAESEMHTQEPVKRVYRELLPAPTAPPASAPASIKPSHGKASTEPSHGKASTKPSHGKGFFRVARYRGRSTHDAGSYVHAFEPSMKAYAEVKIPPRAGPWKLSEKWNDDGLDMTGWHRGLSRWAALTAGSFCSPNGGFATGQSLPGESVHPGEWVESQQTGPEGMIWANNTQHRAQPGVGEDASRSARGDGSGVNGANGEVDSRAGRDPSQASDLSSDRFLFRRHCGEPFSDPRVSIDEAASFQKTSRSPLDLLALAAEERSSQNGNGHMPSFLEAGGVSPLVRRDQQGDHIDERAHQLNSDPNTFESRRRRDEERPWFDQSRGQPHAVRGRPARSVYEKMKLSAILADD